MQEEHGLFLEREQYMTKLPVNNCKILPAVDVAARPVAL